MESKMELLDYSAKGSVDCFAEEEYAERMQDEVLPALAAAGKTGKVDVRGGTLYYEYYTQKEAADTVVICHGFSESLRKYDEFVYYLYQAGYQVFIWDQRGHGMSLREGDDVNVVHVEEFSEYVEDLHLLMEKIIKPLQGQGNLYLYAHSMGGCVGTLYLEQYPGDFDKAVLNAPMLAIQMGPCPLVLAKGICDVAKLFGKGKKRLFTQGEFNSEEPFSDSCADSAARHFHYLKIRNEVPQYRSSSASYAWGSTAVRAGRQAMRKENIARIDIPVLLFQAGKDNQVKNNVQDKFVKRLKNGRLVRVPQSKHEIYRAQKEVLEPYLKAVFDFCKI